MVENRPFVTFLSHLVVILGVVIIAFPVWMTLRPSQLRASAAEAALMIPAAFSLRKRYHELTMPVIIMSGDSDRYADMHTQSEQLQQELPHSTLHVTRGAGHMLHHLAVDEVMGAIEQANQATGAVQQAGGRVSVAATA